MFDTKPPVYSAPFDLLTATASDLRAGDNDNMENEKTSVELAEAYLRQIKMHNHNGTHLNCIINVVPETMLLTTASRLDEERAQGTKRSSFHGVPFIVEVRKWEQFYP